MKGLNQPRAESAVFSEAEHLFPKVDSARSKCQCLSTESEVISLDAVLRMDGIPVSICGCGDRRVAFFEEYEIPNPSNRRKPVAELQLQAQKRGHRDVEELSNVDHVVTNASSSQFEAQLYTLKMTKL